MQVLPEISITLAYPQKASVVGRGDDGLKPPVQGVAADGLPCGHKFAQGALDAATRGSLARPTWALAS